MDRGNDSTETHRQRSWRCRCHDDLERRAAAAGKELAARIHSVQYAAAKLGGLLALLERPEDGAALEMAARNLELHAEFVARTAFEVVQSAQALAGIGVSQQALERAEAHSTSALEGADLGMEGGPP